MRKSIGVTYHQPAEADGYNRQFELPREVICDGGFLIAGEYSANYRDSNGKTIHWQSLTVDGHSSGNLRFKRWGRLDERMKKAANDDRFAGPEWKSLGHDASEVPGGAENAIISGPGKFVAGQFSNLRFEISFFTAEREEYFRRAHTEFKLLKNQFCLLGV